MHDELVERRRWIDDAHFQHALNFCMLLPGPEAQQLATYLGWRLHGLSGGLIAGGLFIAPAFLLLVILSWLYMTQGQHPLLLGALAGLKPAVVALIGVACLRLGQRSLKRPYQSGLALFSVLSLYWLAVPFPLLIVLGALVGWLNRQPGVMIGSVPEADNPRPGTTRRLLLIGLLAAALPYLALLALFGRETPVLMAEFFTQAALVTFGGAYAVLPFVFQAAVHHYAWLNNHQVLDGLALGETTPGPLILLVTFVGFVGGWQHPFLAPETPWVSALLCATVATWFTFLPSFLLVFLGAPRIDTYRRDPRWQAPMAGISAVVLGAMAHLGLNLGREVFLPDRGPDGFAIGLALCSAAALLRFRLPVPALITGAAIFGTLRSAL